MTSTTFNPNLLPYLPPSYLDAQGNLTVSVADATTVATDIETRADSLPPAQKQLFLAMVDDDSANLAPIDGAPPANLDTLLGSLENVAQSTMLARFLSLGVDPAELAEVIVELASGEETEALYQQVNDLQQAEAALEAQAGEDHDAAGKLRSGAVMALAMACVSAAISLGSALFTVAGVGIALKGLKGLGEFGDGSGGFGDEDAPPVGSANDSNDYNVNEDDDDTVGGSAPQNGGDDDGDFDPDDPTLTGDPAAPTASTGTDLTRAERLQEIQTAMQERQAIAQGLAAVATLATGLGSYFNTEAQADSQDDTADGQTDGAESQQAQSAAALAQNLVQSLESLVSAMIQLAQEIQSAVSEQMQSITKA